jgi:hypothetical protein
MRASPSREIPAALIVAFSGIVAACIGAAALLYSTNLQLQIRATTTAVIQAVTENSATEAAIQETANVPTVAPSTPRVSETESQSATSTPSQVQPSGFTFTDTFDAGADPAWRTLYGNPGMATGSMTVIAPFVERQEPHAVILDGMAWGNVEITVVMRSFVSGFACGYPCEEKANGGIVIRHDPEGNSLGLILLPHTDGIGFGTINQEGEWTLVPSSMVRDEEKIALSNDGNEIRIVGIDNTYRAYVNGNELSSVSLNGAMSGPIGLLFRTSSAVSAAESYAPRFDSIKITSLP